MKWIETSRFRCNYFKQQHGLGAVFRLIPTKIATLEELGVPTVRQGIRPHEIRPGAGHGAHGLR